MSLKGLDHMHASEQSYRRSDLRKHLNLEPFIKVDNTKERPEEDEIQQRAVVNEDCPQCNHPQLEYYTRQLRSADEGQTVFYECPKCHHKFAQIT